MIETYNEYTSDPSVDQTDTFRESDPVPVPVPTPIPGPVPDPVPDNGLSDGTPVNPASMKMSALSGFVYSPEGIPLQNV